MSIQMDTRTFHQLRPYYDKNSSESLLGAGASMVAILVTFSAIVLARIITHNIGSNSVKRYFIEFPLIIIPSVLFVTIATNYSIHFITVMIMLLIIFIFRTKSISIARKRSQFYFGSRPLMVTLLRALTHLITAVCILAIDFEIFHRSFRKSRQFGAHLMDTGIGLFVLMMGLVSSRPHNWSAVRNRLLKSAVPLVLLGIGRTVVITLFGYGQDPHEYGQHLNAFFTLGLTQLISTIISALARSNTQLLGLGTCILLIHQIGMSNGLSDYVMDDENPRESFLDANREGLLSLPGFVTLYMISICIGKWLVGKEEFSYVEMKRKLWSLLIIVVVCWGGVIITAYTVGISRVTCNAGYVLWMLAILVTMLWLSLFVCEFIVNSVLPSISLPTLPSPMGMGKQNTDSSLPFVICEAINMNGLTFFILANLLTGGVNAFLIPENRSKVESVLILCIYMLLATGIVFILHRKGIRIA